MSDDVSPCLYDDGRCYVHDHAVVIEIGDDEPDDADLWRLLAVILADDTGHVAALEELRAAIIARYGP